MSFVFTINAFSLLVSDVQHDIRTGQTQAGFTGTLRKVHLDKRLKVSLYYYTKFYSDFQKFLLKVH